MEKPFIFLKNISLYFFGRFVIDGFFIILQKHDVGIQNNPNSEVLIFITNCLFLSFIFFKTILELKSSHDKQKIADLNHQIINSALNIQNGTKSELEINKETNKIIKAVRDFSSK